MQGRKQRSSGAPRVISVAPANHRARVAVAPSPQLEKADFGIEELLRAIEDEQHGQNDDGLTTQEWAARLGWSTSRAGRAIRKLWLADKIVEGKRAMKKMGGGTHLNNVYRLKPRADKLP